jgi:hypothetical protein
MATSRTLGAADDPRGMMTCMRKLPGSPGWEASTRTQAWFVFTRSVLMAEKWLTLAT